MENQFAIFSYQVFDGLRGSNKFHVNSFIFRPIF